MDTLLLLFDNGIFMIFHKKIIGEHFSTDYRLYSKAIERQSNPTLTWNSKSIIIVYPAIQSNHAYHIICMHNLSSNIPITTMHTKSFISFSKKIQRFWLNFRFSFNIPYILTSPSAENKNKFDNRGTLFLHNRSLAYSLLKKRLL